jgi:tetratricopeptide (TPR) repeat protein
MIMLTAMRRGLRHSLALSAILLTGLLGQAQADKAELLFNQAVTAQSHGDTTEAIRLYVQVTHLSPHEVAVFNNLGALLYDTRQYAAAVRALRQAVALSPKLPQAHTMLGAALLAAGDARQARRELENALASKPGDERTENLLIQAEQSMGDQTAALLVLEARVLRHPQDQQATYELGRAYLVLSQSMLLRARSLAPDSSLSHIMQGEIEEGAGHMQAAETEYRISVERGPDQSITHEHLGNVYWLQGLWEKAGGEFAEALRLDPDNCGAAWKEADTLLNLQVEPDKALELLQRSVERCPNLDQARVDRAKALIALSRPADALPDLLQAELDAPSEPTIHFLLAKVYRGLGKADESAAETAIFGKLSVEAATPDSAKH